MNTYLPRLESTREAWLEFVNPEINPSEELDAVVSSLDSMRLDPALPEVSNATLVSLHGALLLFQLGGRVALVPPVSGFPFGRRLTERRVANAARRLMVSADPYDNWLRASHEIDSLIGLIDPELGLAVRSVA